MGDSDDRSDAAGVSGVSGMSGEVRRPPRAGRGPRAHPSGARRATAALALASGLWLLALAASQATSAAVAAPFFERTIAALGDVRALLQLHEPQIRAAANASSGTGGGDARVAVPGFPVQGVTLPRELARNGSREDWEHVLLLDGARAAYERGPTAFAPGGAVTSSGIFSTSQWVRVVMGAVSTRTHGVAWALAWVLGLATLAQATLLLAITDGARRLVAAGLALVGGAMIAATLGLGGALVAYAVTTGSDGAFVGEVSGLIRAIAWTPLYDAARLGAAGFAIAVPAAAVAAWLARTEDDAPAHDARGDRT